MAALPRWTARASLWYSQNVSLGSPDCRFSLAPICVIVACAPGPKAPLVSNARGEKRKRSVRAAYLRRFASSAARALDPECMAELFSVPSPKVLTHVASQQSDLPLAYGMRVIPSGLLPSPRSSPDGSKTAGTPALRRARKMTSLRAACRGNLPAFRRQESRW